MKKYRNGLRFLSFLVLVLLLVSPSTAYAGQKYYRLTEEEMAVLDYSLNKLSERIAQSKKESQELRKEAQVLKKESQELTSEAKVLKAQLQSQMTLLDSANQSLAEQKKEEQRRTKVLKAQRTLWQIIAIGSLYFAFTK